MRLMGRKNRDGSDDPEVKKIVDKHKRDDELIALIPKPVDRVSPMVSKEVADKWENLIQVRLDALAQLQSVVMKIEAKVNLMEETEGVDLKVYMGGLVEWRRSIESLAKSIDDSIPQFYDPKEQALDTKLEVIVTYEPE